MAKAAAQNQAIQMLKHDHDKVKKLFKQFEGADEESEQQEIADQAILELKIHAAIEEEIFYPSMREAVADDEEGADLLNEAHEEHHVAKLLIREIEELEPSDEAFCAKFMVLSESVRHHIQEEEKEMFPLAKKKKLDASVAERMEQRKQELEANPSQLEELVKA